jgi:hypothetical protein
LTELIQAEIGYVPVITFLSEGEGMEFERGSPEYMAWLQARGEELNKKIGAVPVSGEQAAHDAESGEVFVTFVPALRQAVVLEDPKVRRFASWRVDISVSWGYESQHLQLRAGRWLNILAGHSFDCAGERYGYEGKFFTTWWTFEGGLSGELQVEYSSRHETAIGFCQSLDNARTSLWSVAKEGVRPAARIYLDRDRVRESRALIATLPPRDRQALVPEARRQERERLAAARRSGDPRYEGWAQAEFDQFEKSYVPEELLIDLR